MRLSDISKINQVAVYKDQTRVGILRRTPNGSIYEYDDKFYQRALNGDRLGLSTSINLQRKSFSTVGDNLHPFFAGLLPEGARLIALQKAVKTSSSDLFSLLLASGEDLIGDVSVKISEVSVRRKRSLKVDTPLNKLSFHDLFKESIRSDLYETKLGDPSIPGVQPKVSAGMISFPVNLAKRNRRYILKLSPKDYPLLVENEYYFMLLAKSCGFSVANVQLVKDGTGTSGLLVERFDRFYDKHLKQIRKIQQEDICQLLNRYPADKYRFSMREAMKAVASNVAAPIVETSKLLNLAMFSYLIGNGDMHAKNISVYRSPSTDELTLSPGYDILSTIPYGDEKMALEVEGKTKNLLIEDFVTLGRRHEIPEKAIHRQIAELTESVGRQISATVIKIGFPVRKRTYLERIIRERIDGLQRHL